MDKGSIKARINEARPPLAVAAPLTHSICWGYVFVNILMGAGMALFYNATPPLAVADVFSYRQWGFVFIMLGLITAYGLIRNEWTLTKRTQLLCVMVKAFWAVALLVRCIEAPQTIVITTVWLFFTYVQSVTYIHFVPNTPLADRANMGDEADVV